MAPLKSTVMESLYPVYSICCADVIAKFTSSKEERKGPEQSLQAGEKLQACVSKSVVALKGTPCDDIRRAYASCLNEDERQSKGRRLACNRQFVASLEECTAQHLGRLD